jgi:DNA-binding NarL/FixJ family response regulator
MRILIADDNETYRVFIRRVLDGEKDMTVSGEASDGLEAFRLARKLQPDLVLMDIDLPVLDGPQAARMIKQILPWTSVIMLSPLDGPAYQNAATNSGACELLSKFSPLPEFIKTVRNSSPSNGFWHGQL